MSFNDCQDYRVTFEEYAQKHYIKDFEKKYKSQWKVTYRALLAELRHLDRLVENCRTNPPIHMTQDRTQWILKHEFVIAGQKISRKASGCRLVAHIDENQKKISILLIYHKNHVGKAANETAWWDSIVKAEYKHLLKDFSF